jgi:hypothetical protein
VCEGLGCGGATSTRGAGGGALAMIIPGCGCPGVTTVATPSDGAGGGVGFHSPRRIAHVPFTFSHCGGTHVRPTGGLCHCPAAHAYCLPFQTQ